MQTHVANTPLNATMHWKATLAIAGVFIGCCSNIVFMEILVKDDPGCGILLTFCQFGFTALYGFIFTTKFGTVKNKIPMRDYVILILMFFLSSLANNCVFSFNIPMPLHMIFRAGSLMANMVMGIFILKKTYPFLKYMSVIMITIGIIICTVQSGVDVKGQGSENRTDEENAAMRMTDIFWWSVGIAILTFALFLSARMGLFQETLYKQRGKHPWEALFYTHAMPLPLFFLLSSNLWEHWLILGQGPAVFLGISSAKYNLLGYVLTQYICISSVYILTTECASLTVTLTVTLRKFVSLIFSIIYFKNPFTIAHWIGTLFVFVGTLIFTELLQKAVTAVIPQKPKEKTK